jgi:hypothetical protein
MEAAQARLGQREGGDTDRGNTDMDPEALAREHPVGPGPVGRVAVDNRTGNMGEDGRAHRAGPDGPREAGTGTGSKGMGRGIAEEEDPAAVGPSLATFGLCG